jgi:hypothetical protein
MSVRVRCFTNLDGYRHEEWPIEMEAVPSLGDRVKSRRGTSLAVVGVTHAMCACDPQQKPHPIVEVELHKPTLR